MLETNVLGLVRMTRLVLPHMEDGRGHIVNLGSWAGREAYPQGGMYVGSKTAVLALTQVMRKELVGRIKVSTVDPGMVGDTEFSDVRFRGDQERKDSVYHGVDYLTPADVADCILFALTRWRRPRRPTRAAAATPISGADARRLDEDLARYDRQGL